MNYTDIKDFSERCETHPDHQDGIVSNLMLVQRMHEEIEELRAYIEGKKWVGLTAEDIEGLRHRNANDFTLAAILYEAESILKDKNT